MAVVNGPYFMSYTNDGESPLTDPDQPSTSYESNVSTEVATPINISTEGPKIKKNITVIATGSWLPEPCPPPTFSERTKEMISKEITDSSC